MKVVLGAFSKRTGMILLMLTVCAGLIWAGGAQESSAGTARETTAAPTKYKQSPMLDSVPGLPPVEERLPESHKQMKDTLAYLSPLTSVLKGLLNEGVSIIAFEKIVEKFKQLNNERKDLLSIIESIRSIPEIRPKLPGNSEQYSFYQLGQNFEAQIKKEIYKKKNFQPVLAMTSAC